MITSDVSLDTDSFEPLAKPSVWRRLRHLPLPLIIGAVLVVTFLLVAMVSFVWTPHDPLKLVVRDRLLPAGSPGYLFGTDKFGRDVLSQLMVGARNSLFVSMLSTTVALTVGALLGLVTAGAGPGGRNVLSRVIDVGVALPGILIALVLARRQARGPCGDRGNHLLGSSDRSSSNDRTCRQILALTSSRRRTLTDGASGTSFYTMSLRTSHRCSSCWDRSCSPRQS